MLSAFTMQHVQDQRLLALEFDEQWSSDKKSKDAAWRMNGMPQVTCGTTRLWPLTASWWCRYGWANAPMTRRWPWFKTPKAGCVRGTYRRCLPMPLRAMSRPCWRYLDVVIRKRAGARRPVIRWRQGLAYGQVKKRYTGNRVAGVEVRAVHGKARLAHVLSLLGYTQINTSVVERHNGTRSPAQPAQSDVRRWPFPKRQRYHRWMSWLSVGRYNFCRPHSSLQVKQASQVTHRSQAMAVGLTDHCGQLASGYGDVFLGGQRIIAGHDRRCAHAAGS